MNDCMGKVRSWTFDSVIGIGGTSPDRGDEDIAERITWVGSGARPASRHRRRGPTITFEHFIRLDETGPLLRDMAPRLYEHMFLQKRIPRAGLSLNLPVELQDEIREVIKWVFRSKKRKKKPAPLPVPATTAGSACSCCKPRKRIANRSATRRS